jgi:hypothetical protein
MIILTIIMNNKEHIYYSSFSLLEGLTKENILRFIAENKQAEKVNVLNSFCSVTIDLDFNTLEIDNYKKVTVMDIEKSIPNLSFN